jgi:tetratricopeptide (TPR) repeat protein
MATEATVAGGPLPGLRPVAALVCLAWDDLVVSLRTPWLLERAQELADGALQPLVDEHGGSWVKREGRVRVAAFEDGTAAVRWAMLARAALGKIEWPPGASESEEAERGFVVRIGGDEAGDTSAESIDTVEHICEAGYRGQLLISARLWQTAETRLASEALAHPLNSPEDEQQLVRLEPRGAPRRMPGALDVRRTNLPAERSFLGRERELHRLKSLFDGRKRILNLTGPEGIGKSSLAMQHGALTLESWEPREHGGVWFCDLSDAVTRASFLGQISAVLDVGLLEQGAAAVSALGEAIRGRQRVMLILDNFEPLPREAALAIEEWSRTAPLAHFVITSRKNVEVEGAAVVPVAPLAPGDALALLAQRARGIELKGGIAKDTAAAARVAAQLDGVALAIELVARTVDAAPAELERLLAAAGFVPSTPDDANGWEANCKRAVEWCWRRLGEDLRETIARCSIFAGGFTQAAADEVVDSAEAADCVRRAEESGFLLRYDTPDGTGTRYGFLETIRAFARAQSTGEAAGDRHAAWYLREAQVWADGLFGPLAKECLSRLAVERENLLKAHGRLLEVAGKRKASGQDAKAQFADAARLALAIGPLLAECGPADQEALLDLAIQSAEEAGDRELLCRALLARADAHRIHSRPGEAQKSLRAAEKQAGKDRGLLAHVRLLEGIVSLEGGERKELYLDEALRQVNLAPDNREVVLLKGRILGILANHLLNDNKRIKALHTFSEALEVQRRMGSVRSEGLTLANLALLHLNTGNLESSRHCFERSIAILDGIGNRRLLADVLGNAAALEHEEGRLDRAELLLSRSMAMLAWLDQPRSLALRLDSLGALEIERLRYRRAETWLRRGINLSKDLAAEIRAPLLAHLGAVLAGVNNLEEAARSFAEARKLYGETHDKQLVPVHDVLVGFMRLAEARQLPVESAERAAALTGARACIELAEPGKSEVRLAARLLRRALAAEEGGYAPLRPLLPSTLVRLRVPREVTVGALVRRHWERMDSEMQLVFRIAASFCGSGSRQVDFPLLLRTMRSPDLKFSVIFENLGDQPSSSLRQPSPPALLSPAALRDSSCPCDSRLEGGLETGPAVLRLRYLFLFILEMGTEEEVKALRLALMQKSGAKQPGEREIWLDQILDSPQRTLARAGDLWIEQVPFPFANPNFEPLLQKLMVAYVDNEAIQFLASVTGIRTDEWSKSDRLLYSWKDFLRVAALQGMVLTMIEKILQNPNIKALHQSIKMLCGLR